MNILWDFDGTLFNTYPAYTKLFQEAVPNATQEEVFKQLKVSFSHTFKYFELGEEMQNQIRKKARELKPKELFPFPAVEEVLKQADLNVIMTHKEREDVWNILKFHKLDHYFIDMVAGDDGYPRKPDPASYKYLHEKHHIDLAIGDRELDILPAKQLGIKTCLFQNRTSGADYYLDDYHDFGSVVRLHD
ncbi:HAD-IA family hydrolase [Bacillus sp. 31A1R]|uniref:HAD-IA family hydrolase n=1 Tax=Robertmurraya mangrovi TaxID=3098077 RepID=A0ABU5ITI7_9BACI|nr:HAD-IA family hydrolase [Bacillus sp. 31A1R]MDZ5470477.1 HAD-IA family hydrolase [Bacillus sp. 31A1R]